MSLSDRATIASTDTARPILFGLLADGSSDERFRLFGSARRAAPPAGGFSPPGDWYGRWTVQPLHGILAAPAKAGTVCPDDIVVLASGRRRA